MKKLIILIYFLGILPVVLAQNVQVTANAPKVVAVGEQFQIEFSLNAEPSDELIPSMPDFRALYGPSSSSSTQITMMNGKVQQSVSYTFTYGLQAIKPGKYVIGAAEFTVGGKKYKSNPINIEVVGKSSGTAQSATPSQPNSSNQTQTEQVTTDGDIFVRVLVDKKNVVQGDYITATVKIYSKVQASLGNIELPKFEGFFKEDVKIPQFAPEKEYINGQAYQSGVIAKFILIPQKSGELRIDPMTLDCSVQQRVQNRSRSIFDDFFGSGIQEVPRKLKSKPVIITVRPLPDNKPGSFNGAVGRFSLDVKVDKNNAKTNDAITLKATISGNGNLKLIEAPKIGFPPDFDTYDPKVTLNTKESDGGVSGSKTFEYLLIPRNPGNFRISPISFTYFDIASNQFKTLTSGEFNFSITKGADSLATNVISGRSKEDVQFLGKDIIFIKTNDFKLYKANRYFLGSLWFYLIYIVGLIAFITIIWFRRRIIRQNANIALVRNRRADKFASKRLKQAKIHLGNNEKEKFYDELLNAIWGYLSDKLNIPLSDLSRDTTREIFEKREIDEEIVHLFIQLVDNCEFARYAPGSAGISMQDDYSKAIDLISKFQQKLR
jgi:hypothetical protein